MSSSENEVDVVCLVSQCHRRKQTLERDVARKPSTVLLMLVLFLRYLQA